MKKFLLLALLALAGSAIAALDFVDVPAAGETLLDGGRLVEVQYFGPAGTCALSGVRTFRTNAYDVATVLATNTTYTAVFTATNAISGLLATNSVSGATDLLPALSRPGITIVSYETNTVVTATSTTNVYSALAFVATNSLGSLTASAGVPAAASTNVYLPPGTRLVRSGTATGRATAVLER